MKEIISEQEIKKFNYYGSIYTVHLAVLIISAVPLFMWLGRYAYDTAICMACMYHYAGNHICYVRLRRA